MTGAVTPDPAQATTPQATRRNVVHSTRTFREAAELDAWFCRGRGLLPDPHPAKTGALNLATPCDKVKLVIVVGRLQFGWRRPTRSKIHYPASNKRHPVDPPQSCNPVKLEKRQAVSFVHSERRGETCRLENNLSPSEKFAHFFQTTCRLPRKTPSAATNAIHFPQFTRSPTAGHCSLVNPSPVPRPLNPVSHFDP